MQVHKVSLTFRDGDKEHAEEGFVLSANTLDAHSVWYRWVMMGDDAQDFCANANGIQSRSESSVYSLVGTLNTDEIVVENGDTITSLYDYTGDNGEILSWRLMIKANFAETEDTLQHRAFVSGLDDEDDQHWRMQLEAAFAGVEEEYSDDDPPDDDQVMDSYPDEGRDDYP